MLVRLLCISHCLGLILAEDDSRYNSLLTAYLTFTKRTSDGPLSSRRAFSSKSNFIANNNGLSNGRRTISWEDADDYENLRVDWSFPVRAPSQGEGESSGVDDEDTTTTCGTSNLNILNRIIGGESALPGNWPWAVALGYADKHGVMYRCGGTLITDQHVLTAAHCITSLTENFPPKLVLMGATDLEDIKSGHSELVVKTKVHEKFNPRTNENDIAILFLENAVTFSSTIQAACLPLSPALQNNNYSGSQAYISGWGTRGVNETSSRFLQWTGISVLNVSICHDAYYKSFRRNVDSRMICAADTEWSKDACKGDSGGPLVWPYDNSYYVIGVVSYGNECAKKDFPGVYARVANYTEWIKSAIDLI